MSKIIFTDIDNVVLDWGQTFHTYMKSHGHQKVNCEPVYWKQSYYPHLSNEEVIKMVYHFNTSAWMLGLPAYKDAEKGVARLVAEGYKFVGVTAMGVDPHALDARVINLERMFGEDVFIDIIATDMYDPDSKRSFLSTHRDKGHYWIEDKPFNAELGSELGFDTLLIEHDYNKDYVPTNNMRSVKSWAAICDIILGSN